MKKKLSLTGNQENKIEITRDFISHQKDWQKWKGVEQTNVGNIMGSNMNSCISSCGV